MKATDLDQQEQDVEALRLEKAFLRKRRRAILFVLAMIVFFAVAAALILDRIQNKLHLIDVTQLESVKIYDAVGQIEVDVKPQLWTRLVNNFASSYINLNPSKWNELARLTFNFKDGQQQVVHIYDTGRKPGCFRIGRMYYTGGEERTVIRIIDDQTKRDRRRKR